MIPLADLVFPAIRIQPDGFVYTFRCAQRLDKWWEWGEAPENTTKARFASGGLYQEQFVDASLSMYKAARITEDGPRGPWWSWDRHFAKAIYVLVEVELVRVLEFDELKKMILENLKKIAPEMREFSPSRGRIARASNYDRLICAIDFQTFD